MQLDDLNTPAALLNATQMQRNIARMQSRMDALGVALRPHVKTSKSLPIVQAQIAAGARGITVSTLKEAQQLGGVTEVRAGVCEPHELALSVLTTVIGHQLEKGWVLVDAGWMAMSRDRGTQKQAQDYGYGQVCDA
jgi:threo-3-hydroxy-D-aspartate ammonia-lyase